MKMPKELEQPLILLMLCISALLAITLAINIRAYHSVKAQAAAYQSLYLTTLKISEDLQSRTGQLQANAEDLDHALKASEQRAQILTLAQRILKNSAKRCNITPDQAYNLATIFTEIGAKEGVPGELLAAVGERESCYRQSARGAAGEIGTMQVMPQTALLYGFNPRVLKTTYGNISVAAHILSQELAKTTLSRALLIYNQGHSTDTGSTYNTGVLVMYKKLGGK